MIQKHVGMVHMITFLFLIPKISDFHFDGRSPLGFQMHRYGLGKYRHRVAKAGQKAMAFRRRVEGHIRNVIFAPTAAGLDLLQEL